MPAPIGLHTFDLPDSADASIEKTITVRLGDCAADLAPYGEVVSCEDGQATLRVPKSDTARVTERLLADLPIADLTVEDPPIEEVIERVFTQAAG